MTSGTLSLLLVLLGSASDQIETAGRTAWFLNSYLPASQRLEQTYSHLTMEAVTEYLDGPRKGEVRHLRYTGFGHQHRVDALRSPDGATVGTMIVSDNDSVIIHKEEACELRGVCRVESAPADIVLEQIRLSMRLPFAPWCFCRSSIRRLLLDESCRIFRVSVDEDDRYGRICDVEWGFVEDERVRQEGRFRFAVDHSWVLLEGEMQLESSNQIGICCSYGVAEAADVPMIRTAELWYRGPSGRNVFRRFRCRSSRMLTSPPAVFNPVIERLVAELSGAGPAQSRWQSPVAAGVLGTALLFAGGLPFYCRWKGPFASGIVSGPLAQAKSRGDASPTPVRPGEH